MTVKTEAGATKRLKEITASVHIFTYAIGVMEVDGWFGRGDQQKGLSECLVKVKGIGGDYDDMFCFDGGAVCAGIAIDVAAQHYAKARRWNKDKTYGLAKNHLDLFQTLNGRAPTTGLFRGIANWNDHEVANYAEMKQGFATALQALTTEKASILRTFPAAGSWNNNETIT